MPQFLDWTQQMAGWTNAAQSRRVRIGDVITDLAEQGRQTTGELCANTATFATTTRERLERLPVFLVDGLRQRVNLLNLATRHDVAVQGKLGRNRVSRVLNEFLEAQRDHDEQLRETLRSEFREELQSFAAAISDGILAMEASPSVAPAGASTLEDLEPFVDNDGADDGLDVVPLGDIDVMDGGPGMRYASLDASDGFEIDF
jgi:hypothetical protein